MTGGSRHSIQDSERNVKSISNNWCLELRGSANRRVANVSADDEEPIPFQRPSEKGYEQRSDRGLAALLLLGSAFPLVRAAFPLLALAPVKAPPASFSGSAVSKLPGLILRILLTDDGAREVCFEQGGSRVEGATVD
jgi:hypothetical protein